LAGVQHGGKTSIGAALRPISASAEQFQIGDSRKLEMLNAGKVLALFGVANCGF